MTKNEKSPAMLMGQASSGGKVNQARGPTRASKGSAGKGKAQGKGKGGKSKSKNEKGSIGKGFEKGQKVLKGPSGKTERQEQDRKAEKAPGSPAQGVEALHPHDVLAPNERVPVVHEVRQEHDEFDETARSAHRVPCCRMPWHIEFLLGSYRNK